MNVDLGKIIEMFEERFGRRPTTGLLALIGLGVSALMIGFIWRNLIDPVGTALSDEWGERETYAALLRTLLTSVIGLFIFWLLWRLLFKRRMETLRDESAAIQADAHRLHGSSSALNDESRRLKDETQGLLRDAQERVDEWKALLEAVEKDGHKLPQSFADLLRRTQEQAEKLE